MVTPKNSSEAPIPENLGAPREFVIPRENDRDLKFDGWLIAIERDSQESGAGVSSTAVSVFATKGGHIVTAVRRWREQDGKVISEKLTSGVHKYPWEVIAWLKIDNNKVLGPLSKKAWVTACQAFPKLKDEECERID